MRALLNSLGLTLWSAIAIILAVSLALVGYRVSQNMRDSAAATSSAAGGVAPTSPTSVLPVKPFPGNLAFSIGGQKSSRVIEPEMTAAQAALQAGSWQEALDDAQAAERRQGITVFDTKRINHVKAYAHLQLHEYSAALTEFERVLASGIATPEETAAISKTVSALHARAEPGRELSSQQDTETAQEEEQPAQREAETGDSRASVLYVQIGKLYYGFEDYQKAVVAITRGLQKRPVAHLDEAYVYLGLAEQKLGNIAEAQRAFGRLRDVANMNPRILRLWTLYADTLTIQAPLADSTPPAQMPAVSTAASMPSFEPTQTPTADQAGPRPPESDTRD